MKMVKKQPNLLRYIHTETKILQEISHVSYQVLSKMRKPGFTRMLTAQSNHDPSQYSLALSAIRFEAKIWTSILLKLSSTEPHHSVLL
jgi:hypothetical protein